MHLYQWEILKFVAVRNPLMHDSEQFSNLRIPQLLPNMPLVDR